MAGQSKILKNETMNENIRKIAQKQDIRPFLVYTIFTTKNNLKRGECLIENSIYHSKAVHNCLKQLNSG